MQNKFFRLSALLAPVVLASSCDCEQGGEKKPLNIIYIMTDDHSYQTISAYGHPLSQLAPTPHLDRIASEGVLFQQAFVENSLSTPSRACLMTGLYSHQNGQRRLGLGIDTTKTFVSELLRENGYQTGIVGKWHMQCFPKGFDYYRLLWDQGDYYNPEFISPSSNGEYIREEGYATKLITDHSIEFIKNRDKEKAFCLFVEHKAPHRNWMPDTPYLNLYEDVEFPLPETFYDNYSSRCEPARSQQMRIEQDMTMIYDLKMDELRDEEAFKSEAFLPSWKEALSRMTPEQFAAWQEAYAPRNKDLIEQKLQGDELLRWKYQRYIKDYLRCIKTIDDEIGRLIAYLEEADLLEQTVIIYTSDQGFNMGEHGWFDKRFMYEESMRTPLIIRHPSVASVGVVCDALVQNIDYAPTLLALAGLEKPDYMEGRSLMPLLEGENPEEWRKYLYYHYYDYPAIHWVHRHDGVRDERYKLIHFYGEQNESGVSVLCDELYDLHLDPNELVNLSENPAYEGVRSRLQKRLDLFREELKVDEF